MELIKEIGHKSSFKEEMMNRIIENTQSFRVENRKELRVTLNGKCIFTTSIGIQLSSSKRHYIPSKSIIYFSSIMNET